MSFQHTENRLQARASGALEPAAAARFALSAIAQAQNAPAKSALIDFTAATLTRPFLTVEAYETGVALANVGHGLRRVAFLMKRSCIELSRFAATVAANRGLRVAFFCEEAQALDWLQAGDAYTPR